MTPMSEKEMDLAAKLKDRVSDNTADEFFLRESNLLRWLTMYNHNLDKAEEAIKKHLIWRKEEKIDNIGNEIFSDVVIRNYPNRIAGNDKENRPVITVRLGAIDAHEVTNGNFLDELDRYIWSVTENIGEAIKHNQDTLGLKECGAFEIMDLDGMTYSKSFTKQLFSHLLTGAKVLDTNFPLLLSKVIIINAPGFIDKFYKIVRYILSSATKKRIVIFGTDKSKWMPYLLEHISKDQLLTHFGGDLVTDLY